MGKCDEIKTITSKITSIYNYLLKSELSDNVDNDYNIFLDILKDLLFKENKLYSDLTEKDIIELEKYIGYENIPFDKLFNKVLVNKKDTYIITEDIQKERIKKKLEIYQFTDMIKDKDWYHNIYKGIYLLGSHNENNKNIANYIYLKSLYTTLSYINVDNNLNISDTKILWEYLYIYLEPFIEKYVIADNFKIEKDINYISNLSSVNNKNKEYINSAKQIYNIYLRENCGEIITNQHQEINDVFLINLNCIKSFLSIIDEDYRWELVRISNDTLKEMGYPQSKCIDMYFNLFDECQYVKKKV